MAFLSPLFWLGAAAVLVPILLHLVQKEKKERIPFASLMLMPRLPFKQTRRRKLKHLLLLFLRCLGLLLLVAAFARPVATGAWFDRLNPLTARSVVILLDHSLSMSRPDVWARAVAAAEEKIGSLGEGDEGRLVLFGEGAEAASAWESEPARLLETLRRRQPSYEATSYVEGLRRAVEQFEGDRNPRREICWITDFQRSGLTATDGWKVPQEIEVELIDVGEESENLYIEEARLEREVFGKDYPRPVLIRLGHSPSDTPAKGSARLFVEGTLIDTQSYETGPGGSGQATFKPFPLEEGISRGKIVLEPADAIPEDNTFYFVLERTPPRDALVVAGGDSAFYLRRALSSGENLPFRVEVAPTTPAGLTPERAPVVILDDLRRPPAAEAIKKYVESGGGLIVTVASGTRPESFGPAWNDILPGRPLERRFVRSSGKPFTALTELDWQHPALSVFKEQQRSAVAAAQFYGYWVLEPAAESVVLARFEGGDPALVERRLGAGRVVIFASSIDSTWTDFPLRSAYLPLWSRLVEYAAGREALPAALRINQSIRPSPSAAAEGSWDVLDPTGKRIRGLEERDPGAIRLQTPGHYEIRENKATDWVAANVPALESDLTRIPVEDIRAVFVPGRSGAQNADQDLVTAAGRERQQSLWWLFLLAAGVVLTLESWVANRVRMGA